jgi:hypothetical protein
MDTMIALAFPGAMLVAYLVTRPASRSREVSRRARRIRRDPALVNLGDVQAHLVARLPASYAAFAREQITEHRIEARTLWSWLERYGAESLVLFLAAGHGRDAMLEVVRGKQSYDDAELRAMAGCRTPELFELNAA